jgi:MFS family permease
MNYTQAGLCDGVLFAFGMVALTSSWGRLMDRQNPMRLCALVFTILASFPALLLVGPLLAKLGLNLVYIVFLGYLIYGIGMSGLGVAWNLAPISFAGERDASRYTGAHITITGIRGSIAPIVGALAMQHWGYKPVLAASATFFLIGAAGMVRLSRRVQREKDAAAAAESAAATDTLAAPDALTGA